MQVQYPFSHYSFFCGALVLALISFFIGKHFENKTYRNFLLISSIVYLSLLGAESKRLLLFTLGALLLVKLAMTFKKVPNAFFIIAAVSPLFLLKISEAVPSFGPIHNKLAFVGISYLSFRLLQVILDLEVYPPTSFLSLGLFLVNPLTLLAGPIDRFYRFEKNLQEIKTYLTKDTFITGWYLLLFGVLQKFVLAYFWDKFVMSKFSAESHKAIEIIGTAYTYTVYLVLDFSGYSLMAVGFSYMMGILTPMNFDQPWKTKNPQDLWRRFHITLGSFLNDYFFKPIYMKLSRINFFRQRRLMTQNLSLFATFLLMGAWNGLHWYYLLSGAMFGLSSVVYNTYQNRFKKSTSPLLSPSFMSFYRFLFLNYIVWSLYFFSGKIPA